MSKDKQPPRLCPFKKIIERDYSGKTGKTTINERFAPCAGERCMAYRSPFYGHGESGDGTCKRMEGGK